MPGLIQMRAILLLVTWSNVRGRRKENVILLTGSDTAGRNKMGSNLGQQIGGADCVDTGRGCRLVL